MVGFDLKTPLNFVNDSEVPEAVSVSDGDPMNCEGCFAVGSELCSVDGFLGGAPTTKNMSQTFA